MRVAARFGVQIGDAANSAAAAAAAAARARTMTPADRAAALLCARVVALSNVPRSAIPSDIYRLAPRASVDFLRTPQLQLSGTVLVSLANDVAAADFTRYCNGISLGGADLGARQVSVAEGLALIRAPYAARPAAACALDMIAGSRMRAVLLKGIPPKTTPEKLEKKLRRSYVLADDRLEVPPFCGVRRHDRLRNTRAPAVLRVPPAMPGSTVAAFLVRLHSTEEAMRLVRAWHRTHYAPQKYGVERTGDRYVVDASVMY